MRCGLSRPLTSRSHKEETGAFGSERIGAPTLFMEIIAMPIPEATTASPITTSECVAMFISLELSRSTWLMTVFAVPLGAKMSPY